MRPEAHRWATVGSGSSLDLAAIAASPQDSGRLRALELLGRASGAFVELTAEVDVRSSADLLAELDAMLDSATADDTSDVDDLEFSRDRPDTVDIH